MRQFLQEFFHQGRLGSVMRGAARCTALLSAIQVQPRTIAFGTVRKALLLSINHSLKNQLCQSPGRARVGGERGRGVDIYE